MNYDHLLQANRGQGKTTRMLSQAADDAVAGYSVYIVGATAAHAKELEATMDRMWPEVAFMVKFESAESLSNLDWTTMTLKGAHPNCKVYVDHWAIEHRFGPLLRHWLSQYEGGLPL